MIRRLLRHPGLQALLAAWLGSYLRFALRTTRWTLHGESHFAPFAAGHAGVAVFWHERLPLMPALWDLARLRHPGLRGHVLVSRHRDGRFIGAMLRHFAVDVVYGSTRSGGRDRGGAAGMRTLLALLEAGHLVVITPDGPRGPRLVAAAGAAQLAALSGTPLLPCAAQTTRRHVLKTWDRMVLPLPWGRGVLVCGSPIEVPRAGAEAALPSIEAALSEAAERADRLCR